MEVADRAKAVCAKEPVRSLKNSTGAFERLTASPDFDFH
ncbi:hypothetical protein STRDD11_00392 [Streptococcus sp. DD11]|nr:hypothetical protein STRDD11_00392 [Streptococcus sp. DD11]